MRSFASRLAVQYRIRLFFSLSFLLLTLPLHGESTLWITSDIQGYLVGCDCPTGDSAGVSAIDEILMRLKTDRDFLIDAGDYREPDRRDDLLEHFMDQAAVLLGYDYLAAGPGDLRDGRKQLRRRSRALPLSVSGAAESREFLFSLPGQRSADVIGQGREAVSIRQYWPTSTPLYADDLGVRSRYGSLFDIASAFDQENGLHSVLIARSSPDQIIQEAGKGPINGVPDLIVFSGPESPAAELPGGGVHGVLLLGEQEVPWLSLAPRGNGLARVEFSENTVPIFEIFTLERNLSPESQRILALGEDYMDALVAKALEAAGKNAPDPKGKVGFDSNNAIVRARYWYPFGCRDCEDFLWNDVPAMEIESGRTIEVIEFDTSKPESFDELLAILEARDTDLDFLPVMIVDNLVLQGDDAIKSGLKDHVRGLSVEKKDAPTRRIRWEPGAVFLAGLLDGVNPCAFSAMVFLVSALALAGRNRKTMLAIGFSYAAGVFFTYGLIGAGLLGGLKQIAVESGIRRILEVALAGFLGVLAVLSMIDGIRLSKGRNDLLLKLPESLSKRAHGIIRDSVRSGAAAGGALLLGAAVAVIELGCTGQVYLPTIAWMISRGEGSTPWVWLLIYDTAFIIPLLLVFVVSYKGVSAKRLAGLFREKGAAVKFATAGLFAVLALVVIFI